MARCAEYDVLYLTLYLLIWQNDHKVIENGRGKDAAMRKMAKDSGNRDNNRSTVWSVRSWRVANDQNGHFVHTRPSHSTSLDARVVIALAIELQLYVRHMGWA